MLDNIRFFSFDCVKNDYDIERTLRVILTVLILYVMPTHRGNPIECSKKMFIKMSYELVFKPNLYRVLTKRKQCICLKYV